jgi:hypothetical protein
MNEVSHPLFGLSGYEFRSHQTLLGLPLVHVRFGWKEEGRSVPVKGWIAVGRVAYGVIVACGGVAVAPVRAGGGAAVARQFAVGGGAIAEHANDPAAVAFMQHNLFFRHAESFTGIMILLSWLSAAGPAIFFHRLKRRRRALAGDPVGSAT